MGCCFGRGVGKPKSSRSKYLTDGAYYCLRRNVKAARANATQSTIHPLVSIWVARGVSDERPEFSTKSRNIVVRSWIYFRASMFKIGIIVFTTLFETVPQVQRYFQATTIRDNDFLDPASRHSEFVLLAVEKLVKCLDQKSNIFAFLHEVGCLHAAHNVRIEYMDLFVPCFIGTIHPALDTRWATAIEDAWGEFFNFTIHLFKESMVF